MSKDWITNTYVDNKNTTNFLCASVFKCRKCKKGLRVNFLVHKRKNIFHRGKEQDEVHFYHKACSPKRYRKLWNESKASNHGKDRKNKPKKASS